MIFDTHTHYGDKRYDEDRIELVESLKSKNVGAVVEVCAELYAIPGIKELISKYDFIYGTIGIHPDGVMQLNDESMDYLRKELDNEKMVAVGEIGLDYYYEDPARDIQKIWFDKQLSLTEEVKKPVIIHSRDACEDTLDLLMAHPNVKGVMHCFSYTKEIAQKLVNMGYCIGVGGVVTFKNSKKLKETVEYLPLEHIILETDCPYMAPEPFRGTRNDSSLIKYVIEEIARIKNMDPQEVENICWDNACRFYNISI